LESILEFYTLAAGHSDETGMERELALGTVLTPKKETVARLSMQRGVRDGTLG
jgi:hypothetical protein